MAINLNTRAWRLCETLEAAADELRIQRHQLPSGTVCWDFGQRAAGGLAAGLYLARVCLADLAAVHLVADPTTPGTGLAVQVATDHPFAACMAAQYAGWKISVGDYFAMGSGPMRAAAQVEPLLQQHGGETADCAVGVLETSKLPPDEVADDLAAKCGVGPDRLQLLVARTASQAGTVQIAARSVETALHKLHGLGFDLARIASGAGVAPLPPVARNDLSGIGRTNDAVLYGARVTLWAHGDDDSIGQLIAQVPSCSSADFGRPFGEIFAHYQHDFYRIDPQLFSPAVVHIVNLDSGRTFHAGQLRPDILATSFLA